MNQIITPTTSSPKAEPIFSSCQREDEINQYLRVSATFDDGSRDWEEAIIAPSGNWLPVEEVEEHRERLERTLRRRHAANLARKKP